jgi:hypothetical protein
MSFDDSAIKTVAEAHLQRMVKEIDDEFYYGYTTNAVPAEDSVLTEEKLLKAINHMKSIVGYRVPNKYNRLFNDPFYGYRYDPWSQSIRNNND